MINHTRSRWAAIGAAVAVTLGAGGVALVDATSPAGASAFVPIEPCRLAANELILEDSSITLDGWGSTGDCTLPNDITGLAANVTAVNASQQTNLRFYAEGGTVPDTANLNPSPGAAPAPNAVNITLNAANGQFNVYNRFGTVGVFIDVMGYYTDHNHDDRYYTETEVDDALGSKVGTKEGTAAYVWVCTTASGAALNTDVDLATCGGDYRYDPSDGTINMRRTATGVYTVTFPGINLGAQGHYQVSAYGSTDVMCKVGGWGGSSVTVRCFDPAGSPANGPFNVLALD